jgi:hypothetical protein
MVTKKIISISLQDKSEKQLLKISEDYRIKLEHLLLFKKGLYEKVFIEITDWNIITLGIYKSKNKNNKPRFIVSDEHFKSYDLKSLIDMECTEIPEELSLEEKLKKIDKILDKIYEKGESSLSDDDKEFLEKYSSEISKK